MHFQPVRTGALSIGRQPGRVTEPSHIRATDPASNDQLAGNRHQGRYASLRDDLRPPLTPIAAEQEGWLSGRWLASGRPISRTPCAPPTPGNHQQAQRMQRTGRGQTTG
jgi:hypothetical protein